MRRGYVPGRKQRSSMAAEMWFSKDEVFAHIQTLLVGFFDQGDNKVAMFEGMRRRKRNLKVWNKIIKRDVEAETMFEGTGRRRRRKRNLKVWNKIIIRDVEAKTMFEGHGRATTADAEEADAAAIRGGLEIAKRMAIQNIAVLTNNQRIAFALQRLDYALTWGATSIAHDIVSALRVF